MMGEYWTHCARYPHVIDFDESVLDEISGMLVYDITGVANFVATLLYPYATNFSSEQVTIGTGYSKLEPDENKQLIDLIELIKCMKGIEHRHLLDE